MKAKDIRLAIQSLFEKERLENEKFSKIQEEVKAMQEQGVSEDDKDYKKKVDFLNSLTFDGRLDMFASRASSLSIGTHIPKGIHPSSKGDVVIFKRSMNDTTPTLAGTHNIKRPAIDISGASQYFVADASIYSFLYLELPDGSLLSDLLISQDDRLKDALSDDKERAERLFDKLSLMIPNVDNKANIDSYNKQVYFPLNADSDPLCGLDNFESAVLVPLFPSSLNYEVAQRIKQDRHDARAAYELRKNGEVGNPYKRIFNLGYLALGGTKPATTSKLSQKSAGVNYLISNLPPKVETNKKPFFMSKKTTDIFNTPLFRRSVSKSASRVLFAMHTYIPKSLKREEIEGMFIDAVSLIFDMALKLQQKEKGWLLEYNIPVEQKFWLDPNCGDLNGMDIYRVKREELDWQPAILEGITRVVMNELNYIADKKGQKLSNIDATTYQEWVVIAGKVASKYKMLGKGVF